MRVSFFVFGEDYLHNSQWEQLDKILRFQATYDGSGQTRVAVRWPEKCPTSFAQIDFLRIFLHQTVLPTNKNDVN